MKDEDKELATNPIISPFPEDRSHPHLLTPSPPHPIIPHPSSFIPKKISLPLPLSGFSPLKLLCFVGVSKLPFKNAYLNFRWHSR